MRQRCEVCENFRPETEFEGDRNTAIVMFDSRPVLLCVAHARIAQNSGVTSFEGLREHYGTGRRSFVPRRSRDGAPLADDSRRSRGRRASDGRKLTGSTE
jgi:hypothetical protein